MKNTQLSNQTVNAECDALAELLNGGFIDLSMVNSRTLPICRSRRRRWASR